MIKLDEEQLKYATSRQRELYEAYVAHGSYRKAAEAIGVHHAFLHRSVTSIAARAAKSGYSPDHDMTRQVPDGFLVKGVSTYYNAEGKAAGQWVKSSVDRDRQEELIREALEAMAQDLPRLPARKESPTNTSDSLLTVYPIGDAHIGMLSWKDETGENYDLEIAESLHCSAMEMLVEMSPPSKIGLVLDLGDFLHFDNFDAVSSRSGHSFDADGRYPKMAAVAVRTIRRCVELALSKHEKVIVMCLQGNHNDVGAVMMSIALKHIYENEPRVKVDDGPSVFKYLRHGKVLLGAHHGHTCKADRLPGVMATDRAKDWGDTTYRYWLMGHVHHQSLKDYAGVTVESFRILAAKDAWANSGGYRAPRDMKSITYHKEFGEVSRLTVNPDMVK